MDRHIDRHIKGRWNDYWTGQGCELKQDIFKKITSVFVAIRHHDDSRRKQPGNCVSIINLQMLHNVSGRVRSFVQLCLSLDGKSENILCLFPYLEKGGI